MSYDKIKLNFVKNLISINFMIFAQCLSSFFSPYFLNFEKFSLRHLSVLCDHQESPENRIKSKNLSIIEKVIVVSMEK